jgi:hypothetical protein
MGLQSVLDLQRGEDMSDLIERLRTRPTGDPYLHMMVHEAADEIERLRTLLNSEFGSGWEDFDRAHFAAQAKQIKALQAHVLNIPLDLVPMHDEIVRLTAERDELSILLGDVASALEYHQEQTRPIHSTKVALDAVAYAARKESQP